MSEGVPPMSLDDWDQLEAELDGVPTGEPFAWTPDDVMERGVEEFKRLWPERWEAWLRWCESESAEARADIPLPPGPEPANDSEE